MSLREKSPLQVVLGLNFWSDSDSFLLILILTGSSLFKTYIFFQFLTLFLVWLLVLRQHLMFEHQQINLPKKKMSCRAHVNPCSPHSR